MEHRTIIIAWILLAGSTVLAASACDDGATAIGQKRAALTAECRTSDQVAQLPADAWLCPEARTVECTSGTGTVDVDTLHVAQAEDLTCEGDELTVSDPGPFAVGAHDITVSNADGEALCSATLTVTDSEPPQVEAHTIQLWPPNHKFHSIAVEDCVTVVDACDGALTAEFIWASSDEPVDDLGDGHHAPDIQIDDCGHVSLRAERAGPKDGRVYKLGVRVVDGSGLATESVCSVIVDHDQRGVQGRDSTESYRILFDGSDGGIACDGDTDEPSPPDDDGENGGGDEPSTPPPPPVEEPGDVI